MTLNETLKGIIVLIVLFFVFGFLFNFLFKVGIIAILVLGIVYLYKRIFVD